MISLFVYFKWLLNGVSVNLNKSQKNKNWKQCSFANKSQRSWSSYILWSLCVISIFLVGARDVSVVIADGSTPMQPPKN